MSVLESFAIGKPVIGARIGGLPELIAEGVDGLTFESGNHEDLAGKIDYLWNEPAIRKSMGKEGRWKVAHKFSSEKHYEQIMEVYRNVTNI
jgi:glycosyltransferase involved in cell wall biosynthesis